MESRALAEYARCIRPERPNLALRGNIPDAARYLEHDAEKCERFPDDIML
ncbi:hypothetical protein G9X64_26140 [Rhizobium sophorae]|uniref:Uncharacterized protein n=1 Tax=Rhizobium sophorae TaxID=1535242 RepID=A0A7Y3SAE2_9HYPH|nr:hypothetical protein [Rhizobium sophorae]MBX4864542.1 hypothetical protein [Rhizobium bangladeshense]NNU39892.1 hypothetical protein [Rhizobium sophorae]